jgi:hypothetical protein
VRGDARGQDLQDDQAKATRQDGQGPCSLALRAVHAHVRSAVARFHPMVAIILRMFLALSVCCSNCCAWLAISCLIYSCLSLWKDVLADRQVDRHTDRQAVYRANASLPVTCLCWYSSHIHAYTYTHANICMHTYIHIHINTNVFSRSHSHTNHTHTNTHTYTYAQAGSRNWQGSNARDGNRHLGLEDDAAFPDRRTAGPGALLRERLGKSFLLYVYVCVYRYIHMYVYVRMHARRKCRSGSFFFASVLVRLCVYTYMHTYTHVDK